VNRPPVNSGASHIPTCVQPAAAASRAARAKPAVVGEAANLAPGLATPPGRPPGSDDHRLMHVQPAKPLHQCPHRLLHATVRIAALPPVKDTPERAPPPPLRSPRAAKVLPKDSADQSPRGVAKTTKDGSASKRSLLCRKGWSARPPSTNRPNFSPSVVHASARWGLPRKAGRNKVVSLNPASAPRSP